MTRPFPTVAAAKAAARDQRDGYSTQTGMARARLRRLAAKGDNRAIEALQAYAAAHPPANPEDQTT